MCAIADKVWRLALSLCCCVCVCPPSQLLRLVARLSTSVLFIPLLRQLLNIFDCSVGDPWLGTSLSCFRGVHLLFMLVTLAGYLAFTVFSLLGESCRVPSCQSQLLFIRSLSVCAPIVARIPLPLTPTHIRTVAGSSSHQQRCWCCCWCCCGSCGDAVCGRCSRGQLLRSQPKVRTHGGATARHD